MSRKYIDANTILVFIKRTNATVPETAFKVVACLDANSFTAGRELREVVNKCTNGWRDGIPGNGTWGITISGQAIDTSDIQTGEKNFQELAELAVTGETIEIKMANTAGTFYRGGTGYFATVTEDANTNEVLAFNADFTGLGVPVLKAPTP